MVLRHVELTEEQNEALERLAASQGRPRPEPLPVNEAAQVGYSSARGRRTGLPSKRCWLASFR